MVIVQEQALHRSAGAIGLKVVCRRPFPYFLTGQKLLRCTLEVPRQLRSTDFKGATLQGFRKTHQQVARLHETLFTRNEASIMRDDAMHIIGPLDGKGFIRVDPISIEGR